MKLFGNHVVGPAIVSFLFCFRVRTIGVDLRVLHLFGDVGRVVILTEHLDVAAQRQNADPIHRLAPFAGDLIAADVETDHELLAFHAACLGDEKMPQLMYEDDGPQADRHHRHHLEPPQEVLPS